MPMRALVLLLLMGSAASAAAADAPAQWHSTSGTVQYHLTHRFHEVVGKSDKLEVMSVLDPSGLKIMARAPVQSFDSGNGNRDARMLEVVEASKFPMVIVRGVV